MPQGSFGSAFRPGCLVLFALPFAGVGAVMCGLSFWTLADYYRMQRWEEVPCRIVSAELEADHDSDGGNTYSVSAEYRYVYAGQEHVGRRVGVHTGSDNVGSFQQNAFRELDEYRRSGQPFRCYVDPQRPTEAVLYPRPRWEMVAFYTLFVYAFGGAGLGILWIARVWSNSLRRGPAADSPQPWLARPDWAQGEIRSSNGKTLRTALLVALPANLAHLPALVVAHDEWLRSHNRWTWLVLGYAAIGLGLAWWAMYAALRWLKYGESLFQMAAVPGVIGGKLAGVVHVHAGLNSEQGFHLRLECRRTTTVRTGGETSTTTQTIWKEERTMAQALGQADPGRTAIPVLFAIPYDLPPTQGAAGDRVEWRLVVRSAQSGVDYKARFEVPVFKTADSRPDFQLDEGLLAPYRLPGPDA